MADQKTSKHVVTNVSDGPKLLNSIPPVRLDAGQSTEGAVELTDGEVAVIKAGEWFRLGAHKAEADKAA